MKSIRYWLCASVVMIAFASLGRVALGRECLTPEEIQNFQIDFAGKGWE